MGATGRNIQGSVNRVSTLLILGPTGNLFHTGLRLTRPRMGARTEVVVRGSLIRFSNFSPKLEEAQNVDAEMVGRIQR